MVLAKTDARIAAEYDRQLVPPELAAARRATCAQRLERTIAAVLEVTGRKELARRQRRPATLDRRAQPLRRSDQPGPDRAAATPASRRRSGQLRSVDGVHDHRQRHRGGDAEYGVASAVRYAVSDHCDGRRFFNPWRPDGPRPRRPVPVVAHARDAPWPATVAVAQRATAHARRARRSRRHDPHRPLDLPDPDRPSIAILTDPVFTSSRGSVGPALARSRVRPPAHALDALPAVDIVLVSHNHYDHIQPHVAAGGRGALPSAFVTTLGNRRRLQRIGLRNVVELDWWDARRRLAPRSCARRRSTFRPAASATAIARCGVALRSRLRRRRSTSQATPGTVRSFQRDPVAPAASRRRARPDRGVRAALVHGAGPREPRRGSSVHLDVRACVSIAMHFGTFKLTDEGFDDPVTDLAAAREGAKVRPEAFLVPRFGETLIL